MKTIAQIEQELKRPFKADEIEWRVQSCGKTDSGFWAMVLAYVQNRAIQDRLDEVFGIDGWQNILKELPNSGMSCGISAKINGEWITKWDGADNTDIETTKGGISNAMKRAAVQWGIGRYLYNLEVVYADVSATKQKGWNYANTKQKDRFYWKTPNLPSWALPNDENKPPEPTPESKTQKPDADNKGKEKKPFKSLKDIEIEKAMKVKGLDGQGLCNLLNIHFKKKYSNLTALEKDSLLNLIKKEGEL